MTTYQHKNNIRNNFYTISSKLRVGIATTTSAAATIEYFAGPSNRLFI